MFTISIMIGLIQKIVIDLVEASGGVDAVAKVRARAELPSDRFYRIGEVYADDEFQRLLAASVEVLGLTEEQFLDAYADKFGNEVKGRFKKFFELAKSSRQFLEFQTTIHNTFASSLADPIERKAVNDKFHVQTIDLNHMITHYRSPNRLCKLYRSLGSWIAKHYGDEISFTEPRCLLHGDDECEIHVHWTKIAAESREAAI